MIKKSKKKVVVKKSSKKVVSKKMASKKVAKKMSPAQAKFFAKKTVKMPMKAM